MTQTMASEAGQIGWDMAEASPVVVVTQQGPASVPQSFSATGVLVPMEASRRGGPTVPESKEQSQDLIRASGGPKAWGGPIESRGYGLRP
jgi:hypothetical protein